MACKYKYKGNWYSEEEVKKLLFISEFSKDSTIKEFEKYRKSSVVNKTNRNVAKKATNNIFVWYFKNTTCRKGIILCGMI